MAMERVPYLVGGGFEHSAEVMRAALAASTSGAEGILGSPDFRVTPTSVPGTNIAIAPGNGLIRNSYVGGGAQTYAVRAPSLTEVPIQATGSAGARTDLVVARIDDPTYGVGEGNFDPATWEAAKFEVIRGVPEDTTSAAALGITYPAIELARVTLPASTGTVTAAMITDLRKMALPRSSRELYTLQPTQSQTLSPSTPNFANFPVNTFLVEFPVWATHAVVRGEVGSMWINGSATSQAIVIGRIRAALGTAFTQESYFQHRSDGAGIRFGSSVADTVAIPAGLLGRVHTCGVQLMSGAASNASWHMDSSSFAVLDIEWQERAS